MVLRCFVCGFESRMDVCPRCNTILRPDRATCGNCGQPFDGWTASCDACGTAVDRAGPDSSTAPRALTWIPGITEERAKELADQGFRDFSDVVRLALPEGAVRLGLHHTIARKTLLETLGPGPDRPQAMKRVTSGTYRCPLCEMRLESTAEACGNCGAQFD